jgi:peptidoglycan/xylan/chitin deacetylase (PgdA/CDA1 family)
MTAIRSRECRFAAMGTVLDERESPAPRGTDTAAADRRFRRRAPRLLRVLKWLGRHVFGVLGLPTAAIAEIVLRLSGRRVGVVLIYHAVGESGGRSAMELVPTHRPDLFEKQMVHVRRHYRVVMAAEIFDAVGRRRRGQRFPVAVTFDDDLACHASVTLPILRRTGVGGTFFLSGASLDRPFAFWWERLQRAMEGRTIADMTVLTGTSEISGRPDTIHELAARIEALEPFERNAVAERLAGALGPDPADSGIRADGVRTLASAGMEIGFHTMRHDPLPSLDDIALERAMNEGKSEIERVAGQRLVAVAYPHGLADRRVASAARGAGFEAGFTGERSTVGPESDRLLLGRLGPSYRSAGHFAIQLLGILLTRRGTKRGRWRGRVPCARRRRVSSRP